MKCNNCPPPEKTDDGINKILKKIIKKMFTSGPICAIIILQIKA